MRNHKPKNKVVRVNSTSPLMARGPDANSRPVPEVVPSDEDIFCAALADRIRQAYIRERRRFARHATGKESKWGSKAMPRWDGGRDNEGVSRKSIWLDIAKHLLDMKCLSPERFVQAQFVAKQKRTAAARNVEKRGCVGSFYSL